MQPIQSPIHSVQSPTSSSNASTTPVPPNMVVPVNILVPNAPASGSNTPAPAPSAPTGPSPSENPSFHSMQTRS
ncbi:hypothetical protein U1Q18_011874, partial [Sarracenia purpurea var. burkii]